MIYKNNHIKIVFYNTLMMLWLYSLLNIFCWSSILNIFIVFCVALFLKFVDKVKTKVLKERLNYEDLFLYTQVFKFPRFYVPFVGVLRFCLICAFLVLILIFAISYSIILIYFDFDFATLLARITLFFIVTAVVFLLFRFKEGSVFNDEIIVNYGLFASMFIYSRAKIKKDIVCKNLVLSKCMPKHIIAVQSESFFVCDDKNIHYPLNMLQGELEVPCYGAYTMRSEFSFLTGVKLSELAGGFLNPYRKVYKNVTNTYVEQLKKQGYYCVAIHPSNKKFFNRDKVFKHFGFDEFVGEESFASNDIFVSDKELFNFVINFANQNQEKKLFIFVITIGGHGPYSLKRKDPKIYSAKTTNEELNTYLDLNYKATQMLREISKQNKGLLIWYGDHKPSIKNYIWKGDNLNSTSYFISMKKHDSWINEKTIESLFQSSLI